MKQKELVEQQRKNEEQQEEHRRLENSFNRSLSETEQLFAWERRHNERVLSYFYRQEEGSYFNEIMEEAHGAEQRFFDEMTAGQEILTQEKRRLEKENDLLYEAKLQLLQEEAEADG
jgi:hypothetical protein